MRRVLLALALLTITPATASATTTVSSDGATIQMTDSPGGAATIDVTRMRDGRFLIGDNAGTQPGAGCTANGSNTVICPAGPTAARADLGDGNDRFLTSGDTGLAFTVDGGAGRRQHHGRRARRHARRRTGQGRHRRPGGQRHDRRRRRRGRRRHVRRRHRHRPRRHPDPGRRRRRHAQRRRGEGLRERHLHVRGRVRRRRRQGHPGRNARRAAVDQVRRRARARPTT